MRFTPIAAALALAASALAQDQPPASPAPAPPPAPAPAAQPNAAQPQVPTKLEDMPPAVRLGIRAAAVRSGWPAIPVVVVVPDAASYIDAVGRWTPLGRYPVLIDDGSPEAREEIGRFVRGLNSPRVVRWRSESPAPEDRRAAIESAVRRVWSAQLPGETKAPEVNSQADLVARWRAIGVTPPGILIAGASDPAWPAALALSAGRVQPIAWVKAQTGINATMSIEKALELERAIESACAATGCSWDALGDDLDAVTLCLNTPVKTQLAGQVCATTDLLARHEKDGALDQGPRWAWCGQIFGSEREAAYRAMCSLFMTPTSAWLFDGYPGSDIWHKYDATQAAGFFDKVGLKTTVFDDTRRSSTHWRQAAAAPIDAGIFCVNTKGGADEFNLEPGQCRPGDIPILHRPSIVYFVHSFSAAVPGERNTVAGRWLERGAYAYLGSVYEPFLTAFVPTPIFTARMASAFPWGAAVRIEKEAWKLATIGDPLITLGNAPKQSDTPLPLSGAQDLHEEMTAALNERRYAEAAALLVMLGRDKEAAQLAAAVHKDDAAAFTPGLAGTAVLSAFRAGDFPTLLACMETIPPDRATGAQRDALWLAAWPRLGSLDPASFATLEKHLRPDQIGRDAHELAREISPRLGLRAAAELINRVRDKATTDYDRKEFDAAAKRFGIRK